jgi:hypothetical protein
VVGQPHAAQKCLRLLDAVHAISSVSVNSLLPDRRSMGETNQRCGVKSKSTDKGK